MSIDNRLVSLRRFAIAVTALIVVGQVFLGFEQPPILALVALVTGYFVEFTLETIRALTCNCKARYLGGWRALIDFFLSAHILSLVISMLLYSNERVLPIVFAVCVSISTKYIFRVQIGGVSRHFLNPSNTGIALTLLLFPWVGIAPPYMYTENLAGMGDWALPGLVLIAGTFLNIRLTKRMTVIYGWAAAFVLQALLRSFFFDTPFAAAFGPMTGVAFMLYSFYMVSDPGTTPIKVRHQFLFGAAVGIAYGALMTAHIVFGFFFGLVIVCAMRGLFHVVLGVFRRTSESTVNTQSHVPAFSGSASPATRKPQK